MKFFIFLLLLSGFSHVGRAQQPLPAKNLTGVKNNTTRAVLSPLYELENFETTVTITIKRGEDGLRSGQMVYAALLLTDGRVAHARQNDIPLSAGDVFQFTQGTIPIDADRFRNQSEIGQIGPIRFGGKANRIQSLQLVVYENGRMPSEGPDNFDVAGIEMKAFVKDKKQNRVVETNRTVLNEAFTGLRVFGSGVVQSRELRPRGNFLPVLKDEIPTPLKFHILTGADAMKGGYSAAKFLVELKSGGIVETDIREGTRTDYLVHGRTSANIKWQDIRRVGLRYIYPSNPFDRDDWQVRGMAVEFDSFFQGPVRIFTDWNLNKTLNGDGQGTTWWSPVLNLQ